LKYFEKTALTALKARQLAKKVGLIAQPGSQWKWALRKLRAKPGIDEPLMLGGKNLRIAKETKLNLLSNKEIQKIQVANRKAKLHHEVGLTKQKNIIKGTASEIDMPYADINNLKAHTHPGGSKFLFKKMLKEQMGAAFRLKNSPHKVSITDKKELLREFDDVLSASPSGKDYAVPFVNKKYRKESKNLMKDYQNLSKSRTDLLGSVSIRALARLTKSGRSVEKKVKVIDKKIMNTLEKQYDVEKKLKFPNYEADARILSHTREPHVIMSDKTTGVHKYRSKIPYGFRSIYFKGGLN